MLEIHQFRSLIACGDIIALPLLIFEAAHLSAYRAL